MANSTIRWPIVQLCVTTWMKSVTIMFGVHRCVHIEQVNQPSPLDHNHVCELFVVNCLNHNGVVAFEFASNCSTSKYFVARLIADVAGWWRFISSAESWNKLHRSSGVFHFIDVKCKFTVFVVPRASTGTRVWAYDFPFIFNFIFKVILE